MATAGDGDEAGAVVDNFGRGVNALPTGGGSRMRVFECSLEGGGMLATADGVGACCSIAATSGGKSRVTDVAAIGAGVAEVTGDSGAAAEGGDDPRAFSDSAVMWAATGCGEI